MGTLGGGKKLPALILTGWALSRRICGPGAPPVRLNWPFRAPFGPHRITLWIRPLTPRTTLPWRPRGPARQTSAEPYQPGQRSDCWTKVKCSQERACAILGYIEQRGELRSLVIALEGRRAMGLLRPGGQRDLRGGRAETPGPVPRTPRGLAPDSQRARCPVGRAGTLLPRQVSRADEEWPAGAGVPRVAPPKRPPAQAR